MNTCIYTYIYICCFDFDALAQESHFETKRDKLSSSAETRIRSWASQAPTRQQTERLPTNRLSYRGSNEKLNSIARPYDEQAFGPLEGIGAPLGSNDIHIYCFDFAAPAVWGVSKRKLNPGFEPRVSGTESPQTECPLTNGLSYQGSNLTLELISPSLWSVSIQTTRPRCRYGFTPGSCDIHFVGVDSDALATGKWFRIERRPVLFLCWMQHSNQGLWNRIFSRLYAGWLIGWAIKDQAKNLNSIAHPWSASIQLSLWYNHDDQAWCQWPSWHCLPGLWFIYHYQYHYLS